jgi:hypothetical protein
LEKEAKTPSTDRVWTVVEAAKLTSAHTSAANRSQEKGEPGPSGTGTKPNNICRLNLRPYIVPQYVVAALQYGDQAINIFQRRLQRMTGPEGQVTSAK